MKHLARFTRLGAIVLALAWLLAACTTGERAPLFQAPEVGDITFDGDTITITGANFFQVLDGGALPTNLTITVCGELLGNLVLNGETKTVVFAPGTVATITTATKIIGTLTGVFVGEHDGIRITNPDGQTINIDADCNGEPTDPEIDPSIFRVTVDFSVVKEGDYDGYGSSTGPRSLALDDGLEDYTVFFLPLFGEGEIVIDWGDGSTSTVSNLTASDYSRYGELIHEYEAAGRFIVTATGNLTQASFGFREFYDSSHSSALMVGAMQEGGDSYPDDRYLAMAALVSLDSWGSFSYGNLTWAFQSTANLKSVPSYLPENITSFEGMFSGAKSFNSDISGWDTSSVTDMSAMFAGAELFNQDLSNWETGNVRYMGSMFEDASAFSGNVSTWDTSNVRYMAFMFEGAASFNQDLTEWDTSNVYSMWAMFSDATVFNGDISTWDVRQVYDVDYMFQNAVEFNQDIGGWELPSNINWIYGMFYGATKFNQDLRYWCFNRNEPSDFNTGSAFEHNGDFQPKWAGTTCLERPEIEEEEEE